jgi:hypothetical protein
MISSILQWIAGVSHSLRPSMMTRLWEDEVLKYPEMSSSRRGSTRAIT